MNCISVNDKNETGNMHIRLYLLLWVKVQKYFSEKGKYKEKTQGLCQTEVVVRKLGIQLCSYQVCLKRKKKIKVKANVTMAISKVKKPDAGQQKHRNENIQQMVTKYRIMNPSHYMNAKVITPLISHCILATTGFLVPARNAKPSAALRLLCLLHPDCALCLGD